LNKNHRKWKKREKKLIQFGFITKLITRISFGGIDMDKANAVLGDKFVIG
jgi:hypothetical protein